MEIRELDARKYKNYPLSFDYESDRMYEVTRDGLSFQITEKQVPTYTRHFVDRLFEDWIDSPYALGMFDNDELIGMIELGHEEYAGRVRVQELWVNARYRRNKIGTKLMDEAIRYAREKGTRQVILETQNVNYPAMCFYLHYGYQLIGLTTTEYDNKEEFKGEVRFEMGYDL